MTKPSLPLGPPGARTAGPINHRGFVCRGEIKTDPVTSRGRAAGPFLGGWQFAWVWEELKYVCTLFIFIFLLLKFAFIGYMLFLC